jgi:hypothetical protein
VNAWSLKTLLHECSSVRERSLVNDAESAGFRRGRESMREEAAKLCESLGAGDIHDAVGAIRALSALPPQPDQGITCPGCGHGVHGTYCMSTENPVHCRCKAGMSPPPPQPCAHAGTQMWSRGGLHCPECGAVFFDDGQGWRTAKPQPCAKCGGTGLVPSAMGAVMAKWPCPSCTGTTPVQRRVGSILFCSNGHPEYQSVDSETCFLCDGRVEYSDR